MNSRFFNSGFCKFSNPAGLLALALMSVAAPAMAVHVPPDFACISGDSAVRCFHGEQPFRAAPARPGAEAASRGFTNAGNRSSVIGERDLDQLWPLLHISFDERFRPAAAGRVPEKPGSRLPGFLPGSDFPFPRSAQAAGNGYPDRETLGFNRDFSESLFNSTSSTVPVPATVWLFASGLFGFVGIARRRREHHDQPAGDSN